MNSSIPQNPYSKLELMSIKGLIQDIDPQMWVDELDDLIDIRQKAFDGSIPLSMQNYSNFDLCEFQKCVFDQVNRQGLRMTNSKLNTCTISESNFKYSNLQFSKLDISAFSSSFDFSDFSNTEIKNSLIKGCSFSESLFLRANLEGTVFVACEFAGASFDNARMMECDLSQANLDYSEFISPNLDNVILPYSSILHLLRGLGDILRCENVKIKEGISNRIISTIDYKEEVRLLLPYFYNRRDYIAITNIYLLLGEQKKAYQSVIDCLRYASKQRNFRTIRYICQIASFAQLFTYSQLRDFFNAINGLVNVNELSFAEYNSYLQELGIARRLLVDQPYDNSIMEISIKTNIAKNDYNKLSQIYEMVDDIIRENSGTSQFTTTIRYNSPPELLVAIKDQLPTLILIFASLRLIFLQTTDYIQQVQKIMLQHKEIKAMDLDIRLKELQLRNEQGLKNSVTESGIILYNDIASVSYLLKANSQLPSNLRRY